LLFLKQFSHPELVYVTDDGSLNHKGGEKLDLEFDSWLIEEACEHELGCFMHFRLGNIDHVYKLKDELERRPTDFPILLGKVFYSGSHCADFLEKNDILELEQELRLLSTFKCEAESFNSDMQLFHDEMSELCQTALSLNKPISF
jgi:hypothetical protein